jgi:hypothetical protein
MPSPYGVQASGFSVPYGSAVQGQRFCPTCSYAVVPTATTCPQCGTPLASPRSKGAAVLLAVFLSFWTWVYTYKRDTAKFWVGLTLFIIGILLSFVFVGFFILFGLWLWAIIDSAVKPESWYQHYPNR